MAKIEIMAASKAIANRNGVANISKYRRIGMWRKMKYRKYRNNVAKMAWRS
jgi:hypothetical protein